RASRTNRSWGSGPLIQRNSFCIMEVGQAVNRLQPAGLVNGVGDKMSSSMFQDLATLLANSMWYPQTVTISWAKIPMEGNALGKFHVVSADTRSSSPQTHPLPA